MERGSAGRKEALSLDKLILQMLFGVSEYDLSRTEIEEFMLASATAHFTMQHIVAEKLRNIAEVETVEREESAFDDYDRKNGYVEEQQEEENVWKAYRKLLDYTIRASIRLARNSFSQSMQEDILEFLDYMKEEINQKE